MAGTKVGGQKAAATNKGKYGRDFYAEIGRKGGRNGHTGGFAANPELAKLAGAKGGRISKRGKAKKNAQFVQKKSTAGYSFCWLIDVIFARPSFVAERAMIQSAVILKTG